MGSNLHKDLKDHRLALRHIVSDDPEQLVKQFDDHTLAALEFDVANTIHKKLTKKSHQDLAKLERAISNLKHMNELYQFMILQGAVDHFKQDRMAIIHEKVIQKDKVKHEIEDVIKEQSGVKKQGVDLKEKISRHFMLAGLIFFPGLPVLVGVSLMIGNTYAPVFMVCIIGLICCILMGEKIVHDFQKREILKDDIAVLEKKRSGLIKEYLLQSKEIRDLVNSHEYCIHKLGRHVLKRRI